MQPGADNGLRIVLLGQRHQPYGHRILREHIDKRAFGAALHRTGRHGDDIPERFGQKLDVDKSAGPQFQPGIGKFGLEAHGAGGGIHLIIHHLQQALVDNTHAIRPKRPYFHRADGIGGVDAGELLLRHIENNGNRLHLRDGDDAGRVRSMNQISLIDIADAGAPVNRRGDGGISQNRRKIVDIGLIGL